MFWKTLGSKNSGELKRGDIIILVGRFSHAVPKIFEGVTLTCYGKCATPQHSVLRNEKGLTAYRRKDRFEARKVCYEERKVIVIAVHFFFQEASAKNKMPKI